MHLYYIKLLSLWKFVPAAIEKEYSYLPISLALQSHKLMKWPMLEIPWGHMFTFVGL